METETLPPPSRLAPPSCEHCGKSRPVMVAMQPGRDGKTWFLCSKDWLLGARPAKQLGDTPLPALPRDDPKDEVGDFSRPAPTVKTKTRRARG